MMKLLKISTSISTPLLCVAANRSVGICSLTQRVNFSDQISDNKFLRAYSSSSGSASNDDTTLWRRFLNTVKLMAKGSKLIFSDYKRALEIRKAAIQSGRESSFHLLSGKAPKRGDVSISRADLSFLIQFRRDMSRCLPVVIVFFIPFVGYFAVPIILLFPQKVLSRQFLTEKKAMEYREIDYKIRQSSARQFVDKMVSQNSQLSSLLNGPLTSDSLTSIHKALESKQSLTWNENRLLSSSLGQISYLLGFHLNRGRRKYMKYLYMEDWLIKLEGGVAKLTKEEIEQACHARGLLAKSKTPSSQSERLQQWIKYSTSFSECPVTTLAATASVATAME